MMFQARLTINSPQKRVVDISFAIETSLALVGESGSGKSLTLKALLGLLPSNLSANMQIDAPFELKRGESVAFIPQNSFTAFSPMTRIKDQWLNTKESAYELFDILGLPRELLERFPSELSGGQLQRVILAIGLSSQPKLLLLDEPTTALDPFLTQEIIKILLQLQKRFKFLMLFVTHDMDIAKSLCEEILVIKNGLVVETGKINKILTQPQEQYTKELIKAGFANREFRK